MQIMNVNESRNTDLQKIHLLFFLMIRKEFFENLNAA